MVRMRARDLELPPPPAPASCPVLSQKKRAPAEEGVKAAIGRGREALISLLDAENSQIRIRVPCKRVPSAAFLS